MNYTSRDVYEFISKQTQDPIVQWKTCAISGTEFPIYQSDLDFYDTISPSFDGVKYSIPTPRLCPEERQRRRLLWRNLSKLYKRKCDATGKDIIALYSPDKALKVYEQKIWRSDVYNPLDYGRDFDFSKTFTEQFKALQSVVPRSSLLNGFEENAEYMNHSYYNKNCYLVFAGCYSEDCMYGDRCMYNKSCLDFLSSHHCENSYELTQCKNCYGCEHIQACNDCADVYSSSECDNCQHCIGCYGLKWQNYCIHNKQVDKETFLLMKQKLLSRDAWILEDVRAQYQLLSKTLPHQATYARETENAYGGELYKSKDCKFVFDGEELENVAYASELNHAKDCRDYDIWWENASRVYEVHCSGGNVDTIAFSSVIWNGSNVRYSDNCLADAKNCFWCIGLKQHEYCIFNKQYSKEEYEALVPKIIAHMQTTGERGEFFDPSLSPFGYNETIAHEYFPMTKNQASERRYKRQDNNYDPTIPEGADTIKGDQIPTDISTVDDDILKKIFICEVSWRPFRIMKQELAFYRSHQLPLPRRHPDVRHEERLHLKPARSLYLRTCDHCNTDIVSIYPQTYPGKVYCKECHTKELY